MRRNKFSSSDLHITTLQKLFSCRHLLCYLVPNRGKAKGDTLESSATYNEFQWIQLQNTCKQPKLAGNQALIHHRSVPAVSKSATCKRSPSHETAKREVSWERAKGALMGIVREFFRTQNRTRLPSAAFEFLLFRQRLMIILGASAAV